VAARVNGRVRTTYESVVSAGSPTELRFDFLGQGSNIASAFGASIETGVFLDISGCLGVNTPLGCAGVPYNIDQDIGVIDEGFFLEPARSYTADLDTTVSARDATEVAGVGSVDLVIGELGPSIDLDLDQTIEFTPEALTGFLGWRNLDTGDAFSRSLGIDTDLGTALSVTLDPGTWHFSLLDFGLDNRFRNDIDLELRPNFDYIVGSWPPPGSELFGFGLIDETFALDFNTIESLGSFTILAEGSVEPPPSPMPVPGGLPMLGLGLAVLGIGRRRARIAPRPACSID
jgi:hypothetical protein